MKPARFDYYLPATLEEALATLSELGSDGKVLAGGQSLVPMLNMRIAQPAALIDINGLVDLDAITCEHGALRVGAMVRQATLERSGPALGQVPLLAQALPLVGHWQTRNRGTLCGSLAHADPSAELPLLLSVLNGSVEVHSSRGVRTVAARDLFVSFFTTSLEADELIVAAYLPIAPARRRYAFNEFAQRHGDFALVSVACAVEFDEQGMLAHLTLALGGAGEVPLVVEAADALGRLLDRELIAALAERASTACDPPSDHHASAAFRRQLVRTLTGRMLTALVPQEEAAAT
ncbi:xanthine dehydrogenase family protein subunit M [bacterium]|nr:MAG: xanthine dehydrogenase family protein subunit M [bacterium]